MLSDQSSRDLYGTLKVTWRKRISGQGLGLIVIASVSNQQGDANNDLSTDALQYMPNEMSMREKLHQIHENMNTSFTHSQRLQLIQPLRSGRSITAYFEHSSRRTVSDKLFFDQLINPIRQIKFLSDGLTENHTYLTSGANFGWNAKDQSWFVSLDMKAQHIRRRGTTILESSQTIRNAFTYLLPYVLAKWELNQNSSVDFFYQTRVNEPTTRQLQPFIDNSNSLRIYQGNPALTPEYYHDLNLQYMINPSGIGLNFSLSAGIAYTHRRHPKTSFPFKLCTSS